MTLSLAIALIMKEDIGALTQDKKLTELGEKLGALPVHPTTSKMLLFSILMNFLEPALTLACAADYIDPFVLPMALDEKKKATIVKAELASLSGGYSDQLAVVAAFECWKRAKDKGQEAQFCSRYFVSSNTMDMLFHMCKQLQTKLVRIGFILEDMSSCCLNAQDAGILQVVLTAGIYLMVGRLLLRRKQNKRAVVETASAIAPATENDEESDEDLRTSSGEEDEMVRNACSGKHGEQIMSSPNNTVTVVVDQWLKFELTALDVAHVYYLRKHLSATMLLKTTT